MSYDTTLVIAPSGDPIHLDHAKLHCGVTDTDRDALFATWIAQAREGAEADTGRQLIHARHALTLPQFPCESLRIGNQWAYLGIVVPHAPLVRVVSIAYVDSNGVTQTLSAADYVVNAARTPGSITPAYGLSWPATQPHPAAVTVTYDAGYAAPLTADATANTIAVSGPVTFAVDAPLRFTNSGGSLPGGLTAGVTYYVKTAPGGGVYTLAATVGGAALDLTSAGTGISLVGEIPPGFIAWMLLQIEQLKENRGATEVVERGVLATMPFIDGLLQRHRVWLP